MGTPTTCPTCGAQTATDATVEAEEAAPAETGAQIMNMRIRRRATPDPATAAGLFARRRPPPGGDAA